MKMQQIQFVVCFTLVALVGEVLSSAGNVWTYRGALGPDHWHLDYPHCGGVKQSPISIVTNDVVLDMERLTPIVFKGYDTVSTNDEFTMANNGHTVQVSLNNAKCEITGAGLPGTYVAEQFHFHWGATDNRGSEHDVNGRHFPMEMHIVHRNKMYTNVSQAMDKVNGLAVLGFFFEIGRSNPHFQEIIDHFGQIQFKDREVDLQSIPLVELMPAKLSTFYRYEGSLTTPPCYESVIWTIFNETIEIAEEQLEQFRTQIFENEAADADIRLDVSDDFRPPQCMFRRRVYASHPALKYNPDVEDDPVDAADVTHISALVMLVGLIATGLFSHTL